MPFQCVLCGRHKFRRPTSHNCNGQQFKHVGRIARKRGFKSIFSFYRITTKDTTMDLHDEHYRDGKLETIEVIERLLTPEQLDGYLYGNELKYKLRQKGQDEADKVKAMNYHHRRHFGEWLKFEPVPEVVDTGGPTPPDDDVIRVGDTVKNVGGGEFSGYTFKVAYLKDRLVYDDHDGGWIPDFLRKTQGGAK